jgi:ADP-ribosylglycohydrolase
VSELQKYPTSSRLDRITGALLGLHAGDLLGTGDASEGTDLTRAVLLGYLDPGTDVVRAAAGRMLAWFSNDPHASGLGQGPVGNGSLMRCLPTALAVADPARRVRETMELSALTHSDPRCTGACAAYNEIVAALVAGQTPIQAVAVAMSTANAHGGRPVVQAVRRGTTMSLPDGVALHQAGEPGHDDATGGEVLHSLSLSVAAVLDPRSLEQVLVDVVRVSGDSDTDAAIAGGLLGARDGAAHIPGRWVAKLKFATEFTQAAAKISTWT